MSVDSDLLKKFEDEGYIIIDAGVEESVLDQARSDMDRINASKDKKLNPKYYHYNKHPRLIEGWKQSDAIKEIALSPNILSVLSSIYAAKPLPFSTINFTYGTEQPLHSDYFHFGSMPELYLAGVWVALEDIHPDSGPLDLAVKSNKGPIILPEDLGITELPTTTADVKSNYTKYEMWVKDYVESESLEVVTPALAKGQALIWAANTLHGAGEIRNPTLTRYSQVTHYHFDNCEFFYNPNFSTRSKYVRREVSESLSEV